jgi:Family of unknown function (DUF6114)
MSAESQGALKDRFGQARDSFRAWRWQRPFWAGLLTLLAGVPIAYFPYAHLTMGQLTIRMATTAGAGSLIIGVLLVVLGLTMWFQPMVRVFAGIAAILLALVSIVVSNYGGFAIGFLLGLIGGGLSVAWAPGTPGENAGEKAEAPARAARARTRTTTPDNGPVAAEEPWDPWATTTPTNGRHRAG